MWERAVVHLNVAHFAVAVERVVDARLRERPVIVAPEGMPRSVVYDMSEESYRAGVRKGMPLAQAQRFCRDACLLPPHPDRYERAMRAFLERVLPYSPLVERVDDGGHLFLDLTGSRRLFGPPPDVAWRIRKEVKSDLRLDPIWSLAPNKLVAKVATRVVKPTGEYIVEPGEEEEFLKPLPVHLLPGVERDQLILLSELHLSRIGDVGRLSLEQLQVAFGRVARSFYDKVRGVDPSPVIPAGQGLAPVWESHEFGDDTNDVALVEGALFQLVERGAWKLRRRGLAARRVGLTLDYSDGMRIIRQATARAATANDFQLYGLATLALKRAWTRRVRLRHLRLTCDRLTYPPPLQLELFPATDAGDARETNNQQAHQCQQSQPDQENLVGALDHIRRRFGSGAIRLGRTLARSAA